MSFDPLKAQLGLLDNQTEQRDENEDDDDEDEDEDEGDSSESKKEKKDKFDPVEFVKSQDECLDTAAHMVLKGLKELENRLYDKQRAKVVTDKINEIFDALLQHSKPFLEGKKGTKLAVGFNKTD